MHSNIDHFGIIVIYKMVSANPKLAGIGQFHKDPYFVDFQKHRFRILWL